MKIYKSVLETIGGMPLVKVKHDVGEAEIWAKLEMLNSSGSIKDRMALYILEKAEREGVLRKGMTILEATTGNTGISFAMIASVKSYGMIAVMPDSMSNERVQMIKAYGGKVILTPARDGPSGAIKKRDVLAQNQDIYWIPNQFENKDNVLSQRSVGEEIIRQTQGRIDAFVAGVGTGGTLMGVAEALNAKNITARIIAVEPAESAVMSGGKPGRHNIQGVGEGFIPKLVKEEMIDEVVKVSTGQAIFMTRKLARKMGILAGISSGANMAAAVEIAKRLGEEKRVVTIFPDRGERYFSEGVFD